MSLDSEDEAELLENIEEVMDKFSNEVKDLRTYRDLYFENHPQDKAEQKIENVEKRKEALLEKFDTIDADTQIPYSFRAQFLYLKGKCYNISKGYDSRATRCLSKAVKLNPQFVDAWNELGECYWKNMNMKEAKASFEGALKTERNPVSLRCLSIIMRQESSRQLRRDCVKSIKESVELAKEAVSKDLKDGISWTVLGNSYLCMFFGLKQDPDILKLCMKAYKQAWLDPVARGHPDLYYNKAIALRYVECFQEALIMYEQACRLDPSWAEPKLEKNSLIDFLASATDILRSRGKLKTKKIMQMVQSIDEKMLGVYAPHTVHTFGARKGVVLQRVLLDELQDGPNEGKVVLGKVVGSVHNLSNVPFTFAMVDGSMTCVCVQVYNWADGRGAIIGDCVALPEPDLRLHRCDTPPLIYDFKSIRVNNPMKLLLNGKRVGPAQFACVSFTSTYQIQ